MMGVIRASDVNGLPVVAIDSGEDVAEIRDVVYDAEAHQLVGFTLNKQGLLAGRMKDALGAESVHAVGADAVTIDSAGAITADDEGTETITKGNTVSIIGNNVLTAEGQSLGKVHGIVLTMGEKPQAVGYEIMPQNKGAIIFAPIVAQIAISNDNLLLPAEASELIRNDIEAFADALAAQGK